MSDKLKIVYVGNKATKRDTITGSRLLFIKGEAMAVDTAIARRLLEYPKVWVEASQAKGAIENAKNLEKQLAEEAKLKAAEEAKQAQLESMLTKDAEGEVMDLTKYTGPKLATLVESEDLEITVPATPVAEYRVAVRDAMRAKYGEPMLEGQE